VNVELYNFTAKSFICSKYLETPFALGLSSVYYRPTVCLVDTRAIKSWTFNCTAVIQFQSNAESFNCSKYLQSRMFWAAM